MAHTPLDRRQILRAASATAAGGALITLGASPAQATEATQAAQATVESASRPSGKRAEFRWLGVSGWRIDVGGQTLLIDPYVSRYPVGLATGSFDPGTELQVDGAAVAIHAGTPKQVFVTHTHWDHFNDVPHIAAASGARIFGTLTTYHTAQSFGVPSSQVSVVHGGEVLDFGAYQVEVVGSLHSRNGSYSYLFPGVRVNVPPRPRVISDLPEGDTLCFQVNVTGGPSVFFMGASDFVARNLRGLNPDVAMIAVTSTDSTHDYIGRLLHALDYPRVVVPVHWDDFETPLQNPPTTDARSRERLNALAAAVRKLSPRTRIVIPEYLTPYTFD